MQKKDNTKVLIVIVIAIIIIVSLIINNKSKKQEDYSKLEGEELSVAVQNKVDTMTINNLAGLGERDRIEYYVSEFIDAIESKNYSSAYDMLYDEFKKNYFPTYNEFEEYAKTKFPSMFSLEHTNIERNGEFYILWVTMYNPLGSKSDGIEMNFVVKENDLDDFVMSFSVI